MFSPIRSALRRSAQASRRHARTQALWTPAQRERGARRGYEWAALAAVGVGVGAAVSVSAALGSGNVVRLDAGARAEPWEAGQPAEGGDAPHVREGEGAGADAGTSDGEGEGEGGGGGGGGQHAGGAYNPETGEINWDCPCLGGMAHGPCGQAFRDAFACFVFSAAEPKGVDCVARFTAMQDCFRAHPEVYGEEIMADDDDEDDVPSSADSPEREGEPAPTAAPESTSSASS